MARVGYARVSTHGQKDDSQVDELTAAGCERIFVDHGVSGKLAKRPELDACLAYLRQGDVLVITRLSRAMRSLHHMVNLSAELDERGIGLMVVKQGIDTTTKEGRLLFGIMAAIDEFSRELIVEGTHEGLAAARTRGRVGGRKPKMSPVQIQVARGMLEERGEDGKSKYTAQQIADTFGVSRATLYASVKPKDEGAGIPRS